MKPFQTARSVTFYNEGRDRMWIAMKAAAARHGTSAWPPNPPTLLPWYPQRFVFVRCPLLCFLHTKATGYPRPSRRGLRCQAARLARHKDKKKRG